MQTGSQRQSPSRVSLENPPNLIPHTTEDRHLLLLRACGMCGIIEAPVMAVHLARKHRADLVGIPADGDHGFHILIEELMEML